MGSVGCLEPRAGGPRHTLLVSQEQHVKAEWVEGGRVQWELFSGSSPAHTCSAPLGATPCLSPAFSPCLAANTHLGTFYLFSNSWPKRFLIFLPLREPCLHRVCELLPALLMRWDSDFSWTPWLFWRILPYDITAPAWTSIGCYRRCVRACVPGRPGSCAGAVEGISFSQWVWCCVLS